jgi:hypothetical protein
MKIIAIIYLKYIVYGKIENKTGEVKKNLNKRWWKI